MHWVLISSLATAGGTLVLASPPLHLSVRRTARRGRPRDHFWPGCTRCWWRRASRTRLRRLRSWTTTGCEWMAATASPRSRPTRSTWRSQFQRRSGIGVPHGWMFVEERPTADVRVPNPADFHRLTRDIYVPAGDTGFWQRALRDPGSDEFIRVSRVIGGRQQFWIDILYGDFEGGQRSISMFSFVPVREQEWLATVGRHWTWTAHRRADSGLSRPCRPWPGRHCGSTAWRRPVTWQTSWAWRLPWTRAWWPACARPSTGGLDL